MLTRAVGVGKGRLGLRRGASRQGSRDRDGRCHLRREVTLEDVRPWSPKGRSPCDPSNRKIDGEQSLPEEGQLRDLQVGVRAPRPQTRSPPGEAGSVEDNPNSDPSTSKGSSLSRSPTRPAGPRGEIRVGQLRSRDPPREAWRRGRSCSVGGKEWPLMTKPVDIPGRG